MPSETAPSEPGQTESAQSTLTRRITKALVVSGALLCALSFLLGGLELGIAAVVGSAVALLNWAAMMWLVKKIQKASPSERTRLMLLLVVKMAVLIGLCLAIVTRFEINPIGFAIGLGALVLGITFGTLGSASELAAEDGDDTEAEEGA